MTVLIALSLALSVGLFVGLAGYTLATRSRPVQHRLAELKTLKAGGPTRAERRERQARRKQVEGILEVLGEKLPFDEESRGKARSLLVHAGYRKPSAVLLYWGARLALAGILGVGAFLGLSAVGRGFTVAVLGGLYFAAIGWVIPLIRVHMVKRARQKEVQKALPDALDLLVICVEAGLGLNQALLRVAEEIGTVSPVTREEFALTNMEIRAGRSREEALKTLSERTGLQDIQSLVTMLVQADRFGTSIAKSLRIHSDTLRKKRQQQAEEAAAKTTIKMVFPLAFCVFPALFVVILGPGIIQIIRTLGGM